MATKRDNRRNRHNTQIACVVAAYVALVLVVAGAAISQNARWPSGDATVLGVMAGVWLATQFGICVLIEERRH